MLEEIDGRQLNEWLAFDRLVEEERTRAELAARAEATTRNYTRRGR
jgi:hypothetical protein